MRHDLEAFDASAADAPHDRTRYNSTMESDFEEWPLTATAALRKVEEQEENAEGRQEAAPADDQGQRLRWRPDRLEQ